MPDRERVIKDIEECLSASCRGFRPRISCPYNDDEWDIMRDALALLKEQEAVVPLTIDDAVSEIMDKHYKRLKEQEDDKPKGHWVPYEPDKRGYTDGFTCSRCERVILSDHYCKMIDFDFCPYCGAYMDNAEGR